MVVELHVLILLFNWMFKGMEMTWKSTLKSFCVNNVKGTYLHTF